MPNVSSYFSKYKLLFMLLLLFVSYKPIKAESLLQFYYHTKMQSPSLLANLAYREAANTKLVQAKSLTLPKIDVFTNINFNNYHSLGSGLNIIQPIYEYSTHIKSKLANKLFDQANLELEINNIKLILKVANDYFNLLLALENLKYAHAEKQSIKKQLSQAQKKFRIGLITITDIYDAKLRLDFAVAQEVEAINKFHELRDNIYQMSGKKYLQLNDISNELPIYPNNNLETLNKIALESNLLLRLASIRVDQASINLDLYKSQHYPSIFLKINQFDGSMANNFEKKQIILQLNLPIYSGGLISAQVDENQHIREAFLQLLEEQRREISLAVQKAYEDHKLSIEKIEIAKRIRISASNVLEANKAGYVIGTKSIISILDAERNLYMAEKNLSSARYAYITSYLKLLYNSGQLSENSLIKIDYYLKKPINLSSYDYND